MSMDWTRDKLTRDSAKKAGRPCDPIVPISKLTLEDFSSFADAYCDETFALAYKVTNHDAEAERLSINTLCRVLMHEAVADNAADVAPIDAIMNAMESFITKSQASTMRNESVTANIKGIYSPEIAASICEKAVDKVYRDMPRYAPVVSGTTGAMVILTIVAFIIAAVTLIWLAPTKNTINNEQTTLGTVAVQPMARINNDLIVEVEATPVYRDENGAVFNTGGVPVIVRISGPDLIKISSISVTDREGSKPSLYQCDKHEYCFIASKNDIYTITVTGTNGATVYGYADLLDVPSLPEAGLLMTANHFAVPHTGTTGLNIISYDIISPSDISGTSADIDDFNGDASDGQQIIEDFNGDGTPASENDNGDPFLWNDDIQNVSESDVSDSDIAEEEKTPIVGSEYINITKQGKKGILEHSDDPRDLLYTPNGGADCIGIDSIVLGITDAAEQYAEYTVPVIICNNAPVIDTTALAEQLVHTPTNTGMLASRLHATDADGDSLRFELVKEENCSVMLSSNGGYIARVDKNFSGEQAGFSFTISDGLITTDPIDVTFSLSNSIISTPLLEASYACYAGQNGNYILDLPRVDSDGDPLKWSVITPLTADIYTEQGSSIKVSADGSEVTYCIDPTKDGTFRETLELRCTDGWLTSETISYICNVTPNAPPRAAVGNVATTSGTQSVICSLVLAPDDCIFDSVDTYRITGIHAQYGGTVTPDEGWSTLTFTFTPNGEESECYADVIVTDTISGKTSVIRYTIKVN